MVNQFAYALPTCCDKVEQNSSDRLLFENNSKRDDLTQYEQQLSVIYFSKYYLISKIFAYLPDLGYFLRV